MPILSQHPKTIVLYSKNFRKEKTKNIVSFFIYQTPNAVLENLNQTLGS